MGLRIDTETNGSSTVLRIAGNLTEQSVRELESISSDQSGTLVLDLSNLKWADTQGINAIRRLRDSGAKVRNASPLIHMLLTKKP